MIGADPMQEDGEDDFSRIIALADDFADTLDDLDADTGEALKALALVTGGILTYDMPSRQAALEVLDDMVKAIKDGIGVAEENGSAWWVKNRAN